MNIKLKLLRKFGGEDMKNFLDKLDGQKTVIGTALYQSADVLSALAVFLLSLANFSDSLHLVTAATFFGKAVGAVTTLVGLSHKAYKLFSNLFGVDIKKEEEK